MRARRGTSTVATCRVSSHSSRTATRCTSRRPGALSIGGAPVQRDSLFRIASTTKPVTAAATLALVGEGRIDLDEPVDRLLPELAGHRVLRRPDGPLDDTVPATRAITTRDLLTFTFGFGFAIEMFTASPPPADPRRGARVGPPHARPAPTGPPAATRRVDGRARRAPDARPARRAVAVQHRGLGARRAPREGGGDLVRRGARLSAVRPARDGCHGDVDERDRPARDGLRGDRPGPRGLGPARRRVEPAPRVPRRRRRPRLHRRRPLAFARLLLRRGEPCSRRRSCAR